MGTKTITGTGTTFLDNGLTIVVTPSQVTFTLTNPNPNTGAGNVYANGGFRGYDISEIGLSPVNITGADVDPVTSISSRMTGPEIFGAGRATFDARSVFVNLQGLILDGGSNVTLNIRTAPAPVPEPPAALTFALAGFGMGGLVIAAKRKKSGRAL